MVNKIINFAIIFIVFLKILLLNLNTYLTNIITILEKKKNKEKKKIRDMKYGK